jgi:internalin A
MKIKTQAQLEKWIATLSSTEIVSLTTLDLWNTQVADLTPLAALTSLTTLYLSNTQVADLTPLAALTSLRIYR